MPRVRVWGSLREATEGQVEVEVAGSTIRETLDRLAEAHPGLRPQIDRGVSVSVDGELYRNSWHTAVAEDSEVVLLPRLAGG